MHGDESVQTSWQLQPYYMYTDPESVAVDDSADDATGTSEPAPTRERIPVEIPGTLNEESTSSTADQNPFLETTTTQVN